MGMCEPFETPWQPLGCDEQRNKTIMLYLAVVLMLLVYWVFYQVHMALPSIA
jgi:hypothetical protein